MYSLVVSVQATSDSAIANTQVTVQAVHLVVSSSGTTVFSITLENTGNTQINSISVFFNGSTTNMTLTGFVGSLAPGQVTSGWTTSISPAPVAGVMYPVTVKVTSTGGASFTTTIVLARGA